jgi:predicted nucleic acid-binding protein
MIIDTSFLRALDEERRVAERLASDLEASDVPLRVPTPVLYELSISAGAGDDPALNAHSNEALVATLPIADLDENIARKAGTRFGIHRQSDQKPDLDPVDSMVAATGLTYHEPVVTGDRSDFGSVDGLAIESW